MIMFLTRYRSPVDGREQPGPQVYAENEAAARQIARSLSFDGQPVQVCGMTSNFEPGSFSSLALLAGREVRAEVEQLIGAVPKERRGKQRRQASRRWPATEPPPEPARRTSERRSPRKRSA